MSFLIITHHLWCKQSFRWTGQNSPDNSQQHRCVCVCVHTHERQREWSQVSLSHYWHRFKALDSHLHGSLRLLPRCNNQVIHTDSDCFILQSIRIKPISRLRLHRPWGGVSQVTAAGESNMFVALCKTSSSSSSSPCCRTVAVVHVVHICDDMTVATERKTNKLFHINKLCHLYIYL